jgi:rubrerythrin
MPQEARSDSLNPMSPSMSLDDALRRAMAFEQNAHEFYQDFAQQAHPEAKPLVLELAAEELKHFELLRGLLADTDQLAQVRALRVLIPPTQERFDAYTAIPELPSGSAEDDILNYAEGMERIAYEHYRYLAEQAEAGPLKELFEFLRDEEKQHEAGIQSRWAATFSVY